MEILENQKILNSLFLNTFITEKTQFIFILKPSKEKRGNCLWIMKDIRIQTTSIRTIMESSLREADIITADLIIQQVQRKETDTAVWKVTA